MSTRVTNHRVASCPLMLHGGWKILANRFSVIERLPQLEPKKRKKINEKEIHLLSISNLFQAAIMIKDD